MKSNSNLAALIVAAVIFFAGLSGKTAEDPVSKPVTLEKLQQIPADVFTRIIDRSTSPNEQLAVALGSEDGSDPQWEGYADGRGGGGTLHEPIVAPEVSYSLENGRTYLLDVANNRVTGILDSNRLGTRGSYNHESGRIVWSPNSRWLVESQSWKWYTATCTVHRLSAEGALGLAWISMPRRERSWTRDFASFPQNRPRKNGTDMRSLFMLPEYQTTEY